MEPGKEGRSYHKFFLGLEAGHPHIEFGDSREERIPASYMRERDQV